MLTKEEEFVIVGTGPSGIAAAQAAIGNQRRVLILDSASELPPTVSVASNKFKKLILEGKHLAELHQLIDNEPKRNFGKKRHFSGIGLPIDKDGNYSLATPDYGPGGLSQFWGANIFPYLQNDFKDWPLGLETLTPYYSKLFNWLPCAFDETRISPFMLTPLNGKNREYTEQALSLLSRVERNRHRFEQVKMKFGGAPLAVWNKSHEGFECKKCQMCLSGCPFDLIFNTNHWLRENASNPLIQLELDSQVLKITSRGNGYSIKVRNRKGDTRIIEASKVLLGAGPIETAKIIARSFDEIGRNGVSIKDSAYFIAPVLFFTGRNKIDLESSQSLSQLFFRWEEEGGNPVHSLLYTYNPMFRGALPRILKAIPALTDQIVSRIGVIQGYLHSEDSGKLNLSVSEDGEFAVSKVMNPKTKSRVKKFIKTIGNLSYSTGFYPLVTHLNIPTIGSGFHFGSTFPMAIKPKFGQTDIFGKLEQTSGLYLIDSSIFPTMPATNPTLSIMANAYRVAEGLFKQ